MPDCYEPFYMWSPQLEPVVRFGVGTKYGVMAESLRVKRSLLLSSYGFCRLLYAVTGDPIRY